MPRRMLRALCAATCLAAASTLAQTQSAQAQSVDLPTLTVPGQSGGTLTVPSTAQATADIQRTPGGVEVVPDTQFKSGPASTIRDVLGFVPGVITQPKSNIDNR